MANVSISEAIRLSGIGRTTFYSKYINQGLISVTEQQGKKVIDTSELIRVFGELKPVQPEDNAHNPELNTPAQPNEQSELVKTLREQIADLKSEREFYQKQLVDVTNRLEAPNSNPISRWWRGL